MLEGQGSDELLAGYATFGLFSGVDSLMSGNPIGFVRDWARFGSNSGWKSLVAEVSRLLVRPLYASQANRWGSRHLLSSASESARPDELFSFSLGRDNLSSALFLSHQRGLTNLLQYGDALSMSVNLETRCPFLDFRLVEFGFGLGSNELISEGFGKYTLRRILDSHITKHI
jgi:asparagine synthase (glutamine-hydrolysing)